MTPDQRPDSDERLHAVLREWVVETPLPPGFQERVWERIAKTEAPPRTSFWAALTAVVEKALPRPRVAFSYVAALAVLGVVAGSVTAQLEKSHLKATLSARYVQSVDPYRAEAAQP